jgi:hypothetical protein
MMGREGMVDEEDKDDDEDDENGCVIGDSNKKKKYSSQKNQEKEINILDILDKNELTETTQGWKRECYDCGLQGSRTEGLIITPDKNMAYCHSSGKWFTMLEAYALKKKIIRCLDGRDKSDPPKRNVLGGELFTITLDEFKNEFGTDMYNKLIMDLNIRKSIELPGNNRLMSDFCDELGDIYKSRNVLFFRGEMREVIEIHRYKKVNEDGREYVENGFKRVEGNRFITLAEMFISPWTIIFTKAGGSMTVKKSMSQSTSNVALASPNLQNKIPIITRIFDIQIPIMYHGKLTFPKKGYDKRFGSWLPYNAPQIKEDMFTLEESKAMIGKIFEEFCFLSEKDRIHAIAGFITPFLRGLFPKFSTRTPIFIYMANRERAGKDYCAGCSGILYEGANTEEPAISNDEKGASNANEEIRKKIMACMIQGKKRFHSANNKGLLNNSVLEGVTTAEVWSDRILGRSENVTFNNEMDYSLSGNLGIRLTPDLANRARIINLHLVDEDANAREFKNPKLHEWIMENRGAIISALYVLVKKWVDEGKKKGSLPFTSFPHWAEVCGGVMECAGYENPCKTDKTAIVSLDSETEEMKQLFESCCKSNPDEWLTKKELQEIVVSESIMPSTDFSAMSDQVRFGQKIDRYVNRIMSGILMTVESLEQRASRRRYRFSKNTGVVGGPIKIIKIEDEKNIGKVGKVENEIILKDDNHNVDKIDHKTDKNHQDIGRVGEIGKGPYQLYNNLIVQSNPRRDLTNIAIPTKTSLEPQNIENLDNFPKKLETLDDFSKKYKDFIKKEEEVKREKTDRELQFYESPETSEIKIQCTKEQVLEWVKNNPKVSFEKMDEVLGMGCLKYIGELLTEGLIKPGDDGWSLI